MADDSQMMEDLNSLADAHQEEKPKPPGTSKFATGPGSGPLRGRRAAAAQPTLVAPRPRRIPDPPAFVTVWTWALVGLGLILLGMIALIPQYAPFAWAKNLPSFIKEVSYPLLGLGFLAVAMSRGLTQRTYEIGRMKDRKDANAWKIFLIAVQGFLLSVVGLYLLGSGLHMFKRVENPVAMTVILLVFVAYGVWYLMAYIHHRWNPISSWVMALIASGLATLSLFLWITVQQVFLSLILGGFALTVGIASVVLAPKDRLPSKHWWALVAVTAALLVLPCIGMLSAGSKNTPLIKLAPSYKGLKVSASNLVYSVDGETLALCQGTGNQYSLLFLKGGDQATPAVNVKGGEAPFRTVFVKKGSEAVCDFTVAGVRHLYLVDVKTGKTTNLTREAVMPLEDGSPWSEETGRFLYTARTGSSYEMMSVSPDKPLVPKVLYKDPEPVMGLSWLEGGQSVVWHGGPVEDPAVFRLDTATHEVRVVVRPPAPEGSAYTPEGEKAIVEIGKKGEKALRALGRDVKVDLSPKGPGMVHILSVLPSADSFRLLYSFRRGKTTEVWSVFPDGEKPMKAYATDGTLHHLAWTPDGQQAILEEDVPGWHHFFVLPVRNVRLLDVNTGRFTTLILPQVSHWSPAVSPDGAKVAFLGTPGLGFPTPGGSTLWVAALR